MKVFTVELQQTLVVHTSFFHGGSQSQPFVLCREFGQLQTVLTAPGSSSLTNGKQHGDICSLRLALVFDGILQGDCGRALLLDDSKLAVQFPKWNLVHGGHLRIVELVLEGTAK